LSHTDGVGASHALLEALFEFSFRCVPWRLSFALSRDLGVGAAFLCRRVHHGETFQNGQSVNVSELFTFHARGVLTNAKAELMLTAQDAPGSAHGVELLRKPNS
jgi:hypothetical protein